MIASGGVEPSFWSSLFNINASLGKNPVTYFFV